MAGNANFFTMNRIVKDTSNVSSGNCKLDMTTNNRGAFGNFEIPSTGKWYFECFAQMGSAVEGYVGIADIETDLTSSRGGITDSSFEGFGFSQYTGSNYFSIKVDSGTADNAGRIDEGTTNNAVLGIAVNRDDDEIKLYTNNSLKFTLSISATTSYFPIFGVGGANNSSYFMYLNAGQDSSFGGNKTAGGNADGNGFGDFFYSPPANHLALCSANLPISANIDPAETDDNHPQKNFSAVEYTGNGTGQSISGLGLKPDLLWCKMASSSQNNQLYDSSRFNDRGTATPLGLRSDTNGAEFDDQTTGNTNPIISSFDNDGFTLGTSGSGPNDNTRTYVAWAWRANGGTTSTNTSGTISSVVQANTAGGFSIIKYTGTGTNSTVGHGLSAAPEYMIIKNRETTDNWINYNKAGGAANRGQLNTGNYGTSTTSFQSTDPSATVITLGTSSGVNSSTHDFIAYCWHGVSGYSKFHVYKGNGNSDGPYVYTGFRPVLLSLIRSTGGSYNVFDSARYTYNPIDAYLQWTAHDAQTTGYPIDFLANGFKIRTSGTGINQNNVDFYYAAWGAVPFKYNNAF